MVKQFLSLEWKQFFRSQSFKQSLAIKILIGFLALYFIGSFLLLGIGVFFILEETFPGEDPLHLVNSYLIYWFAADLFYRYFLQKLPVMNVKPLMILPIKRSKIIHYLLAKTGFSFFNILPLFFFIPFSIVLLAKGYPIFSVISWFLSMIFIETSINYLNFLINKINWVFYVVAIGVLSLVALQYYNIYNVTETGAFVFNRIYEVPYAFLIPLLIAVLLYRKNYDFLRRNFYLDDAISEKTVEAKTNELTWVNRFGDVSIFLKNDIRMILRNKRPKQVMLMSFMFLFYGLIFFTQKIYANSIPWLVFASLFVSGGFLMSFGQWVPAWDSEYYKMLMSQNIRYKKYLESKWYLMVLMTSVSLILSLPYLYFGMKIYSLIVICALYNIGLNSHITLCIGAFVRIPIELNVKASVFSNTQGFNFKQMLLALPLFGLPILLFYIPYLFGGMKAGFIVLGLASVSGIIFRSQILNQIEKIYQKGKYKTIAAYGEKS